MNRIFALILMTMFACGAFAESVSTPSNGAAYYGATRVLPGLGLHSSGVFVPLAVDSNGYIEATDHDIELISTADVTTTSVGSVFVKPDGKTVKTQASPIVGLNGSTYLPIMVDGDGKVIVSGLTGGGEANTASNLGTADDGSGLYANKSGVDLHFKRIKAGANISVSSSTNSVTVAATGLAQVCSVDTVTDSPATLTTSNCIVLANKATAQTINLPTCVGDEDRVFTIKMIGVGAVTIDPNASETIDGATTKTISTQWSSLTIACNGTAWFIL